MAKKQWFVKLFNLRPDESKPVLFMMTFSFFVGLSMTFYFAAANAIFLKHFQPAMIPVSFMVSGVLIYLAWWFFSRIDRWLSFTTQILAKMAFLFITVLAISIGVWIFNSSWFIFILYTWIRILVYISLVSFWGLAGKLFNIRQGKRIFGLIGTGEVISIIIGYFSVPIILRFIKAADLLFLSSASLLICLVLAVIIMRTFRVQLTGVVTPTLNARKKEASGWNYWNLVKKPYFMIISLMALLPIFGYLFVDFLFLAQTKKEFANNAETIAGFLGIFLGFVAVIELAFKLFSGRFLNKYGLKPSLVSLPLILLSSILLAAFAGTLYGPVGLFFTFIVVARLFERSVRGAIYEPAFQLLYQPVPSEMRLIFQNQIEGIPKAIGTVFTGAVILLLSSVKIFNQVHYSWFFIFVLLFWIWIAFRMYENYRNMIKTKLSELMSDSTDDSDPVTDLLKQKLVNASPDEFEKLFGLFEATYPVQTESSIQEAFKLSSEVRQIQMLNKIRENHFLSMVPFLKQLSEGQNSSRLSEAIQQTLHHLENKGSLAYEKMVEISLSSDPAERHMAACMLGSSGRYDTYKLLIGLMRDHDPVIRRAAILSGSKTKRIELWPYIIDNFVNPHYASSAGNGLQLLGEPVLSELERLFEKSDTSADTRIRVISLFRMAGGKKAIRFLRSKMFHNTKDIRKQVLSSLSLLGYHASISESAGIRGYIDETIENILWIQASLLDIGKAERANSLQVALLDQMEEDKEYVFMLLSLLYDPKTIRHIRENIESKDTTAKVYALEIGDMLIGDEIKQNFFPIFEDITLQERLQRFENRFPQEQMAVSDRLLDLLNRDFSKTGLWTKACAIELIGGQHSEKSGLIESILAANIVYPHILIGELSAWTLFRFNELYYVDAMIRLRRNDNPVVSAVAEKVKAREKGLRLLLFEKAREIKTLSLFADISETAIINILIKHPEIKFSRTVVNLKPDPSSSDNHVFLSENGYSISFTDEIIYELVASSHLFTERYLSSISLKKPIN